MNEKNVVSIGMSLDVVLAIIFITLKLTGNVDWSWWFVLIPLYLIPTILIAFGGLILAGLTITYFAVRIFQGGKNDRR